MIPLGICASPERSRVSIFPKNHYVFKKHSNKKDFKSISFTPIYVTETDTTWNFSGLYFFPFEGLGYQLFIPNILYSYNIYIVPLV